MGISWSRDPQGFHQLGTHQGATIFSGRWSTTRLNGTLSMEDDGYEGVGKIWGDLGIFGLHINLEYFILWVCTQQIKFIYFLFIRGL
jgi:hypothetical protein